MRNFLAFLLTLGIGCSPQTPAKVVDTGPGTQLTFFRDILPITQAKCAVCHTDGGIGPFPLETHQDFLDNLDLVRHEVELKYMPPFSPAQSTQACESLRDARSLPQAEIDAMLDWIDGGAPAGNAADAPSPPGAPPQLSPVDATLQPLADYTPDFSQGHDDYHCFQLSPAPGAHDIVAFEVSPGVAAEVHDVLIYAADATDVTMNDWTCFGGTGLTSQRLVGTWLPGTTTFTRYPMGTGVNVGTGQVLILEVHYTDEHGVAPDRTRLKLTYAAAPVAKPAVLHAVQTQNISIAPHSMGTANAIDPLPTDGLIYGVAPHMHGHGRRVTTKLAGACLVDIPEYQLRWQELYFFAQPVRAQVQTISVDCTYQNNSDVTVKWGEGSGDEECLSYVYVTAP